MLFTLLKKIIKTATGRTKFIMAFIGLSVALLLILSAIQIQANYNQLLYGKNNTDSTANFLVVNKEVNDNTVNATILSNEVLHEIKQQPFIDAVGYISGGRYKASIESLIQSFPFYTDIAFESVQNDFIDVNSKDWAWNENSNFIPMIIPNMFLDIYNFQFSISQGYPQITPETLKMMRFRVNLYYANGNSENYIGRIVGFSDRISSVLVPQSFMDWANKKYGNSKTTNPGRVVIKTKDPGNPELVKFLKSKGLTTDADKTRFSKYRQIVNAVVNVSWVTGAIMLLFALLVFTMFIQLTVASCKEEIKLLITIGTSPIQLKSFLMKQFFPSNIVIVGLALMLVSIVQFMLYKYLQAQNIFLSAYISIYTIVAACVVLMLLWLVNHLTIKKYIEEKV
ncbi:MAG TPA: hypothetical protein PKI98_01470 [Chitinophagaceae bacterium]|nr:hypothetical protein [Chitinophagaceae bacterium]MCC6634082.1 hypothetical protein [Chitinophagaceae bacterium]HNM33536.1 hypothetical protein [Chitinophagaceae bacterium]